MAAGRLAGRFALALLLAAPCARAFSAVAGMRGAARGASHGVRRAVPRLAGAAGPPASASADTSTERALGSMELLFAPRSVGTHAATPTTHVACATLGVRIGDAQLSAALTHALRTQPMLSRRVVGTGAPDQRTRIGSVSAPGVLGRVLPFLAPEPLVRVGNPNPLRFAPMRADAAARLPADAVRVIELADDDALESEWRALFAAELNLERGALSLADGPLWRLSVLRTAGRSALVFALNHAISDQASLNALLAEMLAAADGAANGVADGAADGAADGEVDGAAGGAPPLPPSLEASILGGARSVGFFGEETGGTGLLGLEHGSARYLVAKLAESAAGELPRGAPPAWARARAVDGALASAARRSAPEFRTVGVRDVAALRARCREAGVSVSTALAACAAVVAAEACREPTAAERDLKVLLSLDMRAFGAPDGRSADALSCQAGSMDVLLRCGANTAAHLGVGGVGGGVGGADGGARAPGEARAEIDAARRVWALARTAKAQLRAFVDADFARMSVLVFDWAMSSFEMTRLVALEADNPLTLGRAYGAAISNVGVVRGVGLDAAGAGSLASSVDGLHFAVPHTATGALLPFSAATVGGRLFLTLNAPDPLVGAAERARAADRMASLVRALGAAETAGAAADGGGGIGARARGALGGTALALACAALALPHAGAWAEWAGAWRRVLDGGAMDADWAPLKFWAFFAAMHPLLQPALWISEVLHASPGPLLGGLVPASFALLNGAALALLARSERARGALNALLFASFVGYISAGLDGAGSPSAYNLALDDGIRGCPAYEDVVQPSMADFDVRKYQGRWYELGFHDWTQFSEVYGTTLDIELSADGQRWVDDFAVKGPAPLVAPRSWDKSPVANGAHYFLYGKVDVSKPGILQESGFGLTFPNFIVDVQRDARTGAYTQAIQFQCLERGGVRIFEGINFLSRTTDDQPAQMAAMHARASAAGMDAYGSSAEQMHVVQHAPSGAPPVDNAWQRMWEAVGLPRLLALAEGAMHTQAEDILNKVQ
ncbi:hypothetical protein KFE25_002237 [Diacronema lutheri]|uniref:Condensation domain-containing protein n=1 Tax=Diacronema lutheri TaxID=2081491 RepID=A0A8J5XD33_DIALT|nr:hypothetical protein KFE25_002237 [Diacronema lutheri]